MKRCLSPVMYLYPIRSINFFIYTNDYGGWQKGKDVCRAATYTFFTKSSLLLKSKDVAGQQPIHFS